MAQLKLYTEEQVRRAMLHSYLSAVERPADYLPIVYYLPIEESILNELTPIELPSDDEIDKEMDKLPFSKHVDDGLYNDGQLMGFELGAKWMKEQILNK